MKYRMKYRPASYSTLPSKLQWSWVELPHGMRGVNHCFSLPYSTWQFGVFITERPLTADELRDFEIDVVP